MCFAFVSILVFGVELVSFVLMISQGGKVFFDYTEDWGWVKRTSHHRLKI